MWQFAPSTQASGQSCGRHPSITSAPNCVIPPLVAHNAPLGVADPFDRERYDQSLAPSSAPPPRKAGHLWVRGGAPFAAGRAGGPEEGYAHGPPPATCRQGWERRGRPACPCPACNGRGIGGSRPDAQVNVRRNSCVRPKTSRLRYASISGKLSNFVNHFSCHFIIKFQIIVKFCKKN
jgi:hypothetical protein